MFAALNQSIDVLATFARWRHVITEAIAPRLIASMPAWLFEPRAFVVIEPGDARYVLRFETRERTTQCKTCDTPGLAQAWRELEAAAPAFTRLKPTVVVRLPADVVLRKTIALPAAARARLRSAVELQIDLETPFQRRDVFYSVIPLQDETPSGIAVEILVAPAKRVSRILAPLTDAGITVDIVTTAEDAFADARHNLLPRDDDRGARLRRLVPAALAFLVGVEAIAALLVPLALHARTADALSAQADVMAQSAGEIERLYATAAAANKADRYAIEQKLARPSTLDALKLLTAATPDDTWLDRASLRADQLQVSGLSASTSAYTDKLTAEGRLQQPTYLTPVMRDPQSGLERFSLAFKLPVPAVP